VLLNEVDRGEDFDVGLSLFDRLQDERGLIAITAVESRCVVSQNDVGDSWVLWMEVPSYRNKWNDSKVQHLGGFVRGQVRSGYKVHLCFCRPGCKMSGMRV
jgi:hypothetical protein